MKAGRFARRPLEGPKAVAVLFDKPSLRTRVSFTVGIAELGGLPLVIDVAATHIGRGETIGDIARVLTRQVAAIAWRTAGQERIEELAEHSTVPVINALTDEFHPCQILADLQTVAERHGPLSGRTLTFLGDGANNMAHSYLLGCATAGMHVRVASPAGYQPDPAILAAAQAIAARTGGSASVLDDPAVASKGADVLATDVWVSMGQADASARKAALAPYQVNGELLTLAGPADRRAALPARAPRRGDHRRGARRPGQRGLGPGGKPAARAEGAARLAARGVLMASPAAPATKAARQSQIAAILSREQVHSQEQLAALLGKYARLHVAQATLSRDLDELGVVRLRAADGTLVYALPEEPGGPGSRPGTGLDYPERPAPSADPSPGSAPVAGRRRRSSRSPPPFPPERRPAARQAVPPPGSPGT